MVSGVAPTTPNNRAYRMVKTTSTERNQGRRPAPPSDSGVRSGAWVGYLGWSISDERIVAISRVRDGFLGGGGIEPEDPNTKINGVRKAPIPGAR